MANSLILNISKNPSYTTQSLQNPAASYDKTLDYLNIALAVAVAIVIFLIMRFILLWYWKINEIVSLLTDIRNNTNKNEQKTQS